MKKIQKLWGMPILLAVISLFGFLVALNGDGIWNFLGWAALAVPLILIIKHYCKF